MCQIWVQRSHFLTAMGYCCFVTKVWSGHHKWWSLCSSSVIGTQCAKFIRSGDTFWQQQVTLVWGRNQFNSFLMMFHHKDMVWGNLSLLGDKWALWRALTALQCIVDKFSKKIQARGRAPPSLAKPAFWVHMVPQPLPYQANRQLLGITLRWWWMNERICTLVHVLLTLSGGLFWGHPSTVPYRQASGGVISRI